MSGRSGGTGSRAAAAAPFAALLRRETTALLRARSMLWFLVLVVGGTSLVASLAWPQGHVSGGGAGRTGAGLVTYSVTVVTELGAVVLGVAATCAASVSGERERRTWDLILAARIAPARLAFAKAGSALLATAVLLLGAAPVVAALWLLGGVSLAQVLWSQGVVAAGAIAAAAIGLAASARAGHTSGAVLRCMGGLILWFVVVPGAASFFLEMPLSLWARPGQSLHPALALAHPIWLSPFAGVALALASPLQASSQAAFAWGGAAAVGWPLLLALFQLRRLVRASRELTGGGAPRVRRRTRRHARPRLMLPARLLLARGAGGGRGFLQNPVLRKDLRCEPFGRLGYSVLAFWLPLAPAAYLWAHAVTGRIVSGQWSLLSSAHWTRLCGFGGFAWLVLAVPAAVAGSLAAERERGTLELLQATSLPKRRLLSGKVLGGLWAAAPPVAATLVATAAGLLLLSAERGLERLLVLTVSLVPTATVVAVMAPGAGAACRRSVTAYLVSYLALAAWLVGPVLLVPSAMVSPSGTAGGVLLSPWVTIGAAGALSEVSALTGWLLTHLVYCGVMVLFLLFVMYGLLPPYAPLRQPPPEHVRSTRGGPADRVRG